MNVHQKETQDLEAEIEKLEAQVTELQKPCQHENAVEIGSFDSHHSWSRDNHHYYISVCPDCGSVFDWNRNDEPLTGTEIIQLFVDLGNVLNERLNEIMSDADDLKEVMAKWIDKVPE